MSVALVRVDDRLIHGQVVVGWGQALDPGRLVLADDGVASREWEQDLYREGAPPEISVEFLTVEDAAAHVATWQQAAEKTIVLVGDVPSLVRLCDAAPQVRAVNLGGIHQSEGRKKYLPYLFLSDEELLQLADLAARGIEISAQDLPTAACVSFERIR